MISNVIFVPSAEPYFCLDIVSSLFDIFRGKCLKPRKSQFDILKLYSGHTKDDKIF